MRVSNAPRHAPRAPMPASPANSRWSRGSFTIVINADGRADTGMTRGWSFGGDEDNYRRLLETFKGWRFDPDGAYVYPPIILALNPPGFVTTTSTAPDA